MLIIVGKDVEEMGGSISSEDISVFTTVPRKVLRPCQPLFSEVK
jgi:hypothetical protein